MNRTLHAGAVGPALVATTAGAALASSATRTVSGRVLPYNVTGRTTGGAIQFAAGSVKVPRDLSRVKLMRDHTGQPGATPVGYATEITERPDGLWATFSVARTPDGDAALADVREKVRDGFSVEVDGVQQSGDQVTSALLSAVALVAVPAYADARVESISAHHTPERHPDMNAQALYNHLRATGKSDADARALVAQAFTQADADNVVDTTDTTTDDDNRRPAPSAPEPPAQPAPDEDRDDTSAADAGAQVGSAHARNTGSRPAAAPRPLVTARTRKPALSLSAAAAAVHAIQTGGQVQCELSDITGTMMGDAEAPQWLGELFTGAAYRRRFIPLVTSRALRNWRVEGYRWTKKPIVDKYAGDKKEIPSGPVAIEPFEAVATRWAGGNDLDRKFYDFGQTEILESYWRAMTEDYSYKTDQAVGDFIVAGAQANSVGTAANLWEGLFLADQALDDALNITPTFYLGNPADRLTLARTTQQQAPAYLDLLGVNLNAIQWSNKVPKGTLIAGHKLGVVNAELPGSPIRVEAEHIARGGRDAALFGYQAIYSEQTKALLSVKIGAAA